MTKMFIEFATLLQGYYKLFEYVQYIMVSKGMVSYGLTTLAEFIYPEIAQDRFLGK